MQRIVTFSAIATVVLFGMSAVASANGDTVLSSTDSVKICHAAGNSGNYTEQSVNVDSIVTLPNGHNDHEGDIIPPFHYDLGEGVMSYPGKNLENGGEAIKLNGCVVPEEEEEEDNNDTGTSTDETNDDTGTSTDETTDDNNDNGGDDDTSLTATLIAYKIVCDDESYLPNWGPYNDGGGANRTIEPADVNEFVNANSEHCELVSGWEFEYGNSYPYPADSVMGASGIGTVFGPTNGSGMAETTVAFTTSGESIWVREVRQDGYVGFNGKTETEDVSAEIYCHTDLWHYDNLEVISLEDDATYYCVAFNALLPSDDNNDDGGDDTSTSTDETTDEEPIVVVKSGSNGGRGGCLNCDDNDDNDSSDDSTGGGSDSDDTTDSDEEEEEGEVLGEQTTVVPTGAPNTGFGGSTSGSLIFYVLALVSLLGGLALRQVTA